MASNDVVLANLIITTDGVIKGNLQAGQSLRDLEVRGGQSADRLKNKVTSGFEKMGFSSNALTKSFLNVRGVLKSLFIGFSVGGIILGLANLTRELVSSTEAWKKIKIAANDFFRALIIGETAVEAAIRNQENLAKAIGVTTAEALKKEIELTKTFIADQTKLLTSRTVQGPLTTFQKVLFSAPIGGDVIERIVQATGTLNVEVEATAEQIIDTRKNIAEALLQLEDLTNRLEKLGTREEKAKKFEKPEPLQDPSLLETAGPERFLPPVSELDLFIQEQNRLAPILDAANSGMNEQISLFRSGKITFQELGLELERTIDILNDYGATQEQISQNQGVMFLEGIKEQQREVDELKSKYELFATTAQQASFAIASAAEAGAISQNKAHRAIAALLAIQSAIKGKIELAEGFAAAGRYEYWSAAQHFIAASLYFAAATFKAQTALGGGASGGGSGFQGRGDRDTLQDFRDDPRLPQQITVSIEGGVLFGTPDEVARILAGLLRKAREDGA